MDQISDDDVKRINDYVFKQGGDWARDYIEARKNWLAKQKIKVTGELLESLQYEVLQQLSVGLEIAFKDYGRFLDMKRLNAPGGGDNYIENLMQWIREKGLYNKYLPKFLERQNRNTAPRDTFRRMAWAVAITRKNRRIGKPRRWWNKSYIASVNDLYNRIAANLPDVVSQQIAQQFKKR